MSRSRIEHVFVVGIDPGLTRCGFGVIETAFDGPHQVRAVTAGVLETSHTAPVEERLTALMADLRSLFEEVRPEVVVVERIFFQRNANTAIGVAQASGVAIALAGDQGATVRQFTAQEVKLAVTGYGAATKEQVQVMVAKLLGLSEVPRPPDAADALGLALTFVAVARAESKWSEVV